MNVESLSRKLQNIFYIEKLAHGHDLPLPHYATPQSAGMDLYAAIEDEVTLAPQSYQLIPSGIKIALPNGFEGQVRPRSGLAFKQGLTVLNAPGTIDSDYRGEVGVLLINHGKKDFIIERGMRIAQLVVAPISQISWSLVEAIDEKTERGDGGFGHTGF